MTTKRRTELEHLLQDRRRQIHQDVQSRMRDGRTGRRVDVGDVGEISEAGSQEDIDFALLEKKAEALGRLDEAIGRLDTGEYGHCLECHVEISEQRLRALPFAVRCTACEARHEQAEERERRHMRGNDTASAFTGVASY